LDRFDVGAGHGKNVRRAIDEGRRERLTAHVANIRTVFCADLHSIQTWGLAAHCVDTSRNDVDVPTISNQTAKKPFGDRATANITGADKEDTFHGSNGASERNSNLEANPPKST